jgi:hypothetical protein
LVWSRADLKGGAHIETVLPRPGGKEEWRDFRDIGVIAFPTPEGDTGGAVRPVSVTCNVNGLDWQGWLNGKAVGLPPAGTDPNVIEVTFAEPVTVRTAEFPSVGSMSHAWNYEPRTRVRIDAVTDAGVRTVADSEVPQANWEDAYTLTFACSEAVARTYRLTIRNEHGITLGTVLFLSAARKDNWEAEANWTLRSLKRIAQPLQTRASWVQSAGVTNLTKCIDADGRLVWDAPAGAWTVLRLGHQNWGAKNGPAPKEATGWECNKLDRIGADTHFAGYIGRLSGRGGAVHGKLDAMLMDSWECARQTWTEGLDKTFEERNGYAMDKWMPALFGWVVDDPEQTARFLCDWRCLLSKLVVEEFYGRMAKHAHDNGLECQFETAFGDVLCGDIMEYYKYADTPMCEFWTPREESYVGSFNFKPVRPTVSAARMYGKRRVAAESFTSFQLTWDEKLRDLKYVANLHLAEGVTHLIFHTYTHNPRTDWLPPGTSFGSGIGTPFLRGQTWWKHMPEFTAYLARCEEMLEDGRPVSDVLWYIGDELNHKPLENAPFPAGYRYDYCNPDALLSRVSVEDGCWQTPEGISYRVLWIPDCVRMRPETAERLAKLTARGGVVVLAKLPQGLATLEGGEKAQKRFAEAVNRLWGEESADIPGARKCGRGTVFVGKSLDVALKAVGVEPDVIGEGVAWQHRQSKDADWYFVTSKSKQGFSGTVGFRNGGAAELWQPQGGTVSGAGAVNRTDDRTWMALELPPSGSCFVVFPREKKPVGTVGIARVERNGAAAVDAKGPAPAKASPWARVVSARYGELDKEGRWVDITRRVQYLVDIGATAFTAGNELAQTDPARNSVKQLSLTFRWQDGREQTFTEREGTRIDVPGLAPQALPLPVCEVRGDSVTVWTNGVYKIYRADGSQAERTVESVFKVDLPGVWGVRFPEGWGAGAFVRMPKLIPWKDVNGTLEARAFSGTATYSMECTLPSLVSDSAVVLDLGRVQSIASVTINGRRLGTLWCEPYRLDVTAALKPGINQIEVEVTDTWFNRLVYDAGQPEANRKTWTINGPSKDAPLRDSGLLGPVSLVQGITLR